MPACKSSASARVTKTGLREGCRQCVSQLVTGVSGARFQLRKGASLAGEHLGGELLRLGLGAGQFGKIYRGHKIKRAWLRG